MAPRRKANSAEKDFQRKLAALKSDLETLKKDIGTLSGDAGDAATAKMNEAINDAMTSLHDMADRVEDWGEDHLDTLREQVRDQPLASCALAMGIGAFLGLVFLRR
jgi:ElaB/YqjD/DUF883 family membrane-anchored ribosome-binding protein